MKQLFFAGSFALATFLAYGVKGNTKTFDANNKAAVSMQSDYDTVPGGKKDSMKKKKSWGKDSSMKKDTSWPKKDSI